MNKPTTEMEAILLFLDADTYEEMDYDDIVG